MTQFRYQPLDSSRSEFRLLYPIQDTEPDISLPTPDTVVKITGDNFFITPDLSMEFELRTVCLDNDFVPVYTALSYVWGDPAMSKSITVNGCTFAITENLNIALRHLQYESIFPAIWIDAICINQEDDDEKNNQIPMMSRIYSCARDVSVWLGPGTPDDHYFVMVLNHFETWHLQNWQGIRFETYLTKPEDFRTSRSQAASGSQSTWRPQYICDHTYDEKTTKGSPKTYPCKTLEVMANAIATVNAEAPASVKVISDIDHFASWCMSSFQVSEWWSRIWVIQEYISARSRHFQLGLCRLSDLTMSLNRQFTQCHRLQRLRQSNDDPFHSSRVGGIPSHLTRYIKDDGDREFFGILRDTYVFNERNLYCRDAKDRIFALISLAEKDCKSLGIQADYCKTTREVYIDLARSLLRAKELDILSLCHRRESACLEDSGGQSFSDKCRLDLPSWVPDWSVKIVKPHEFFKHRSYLIRRSDWTTFAQHSDLQTSQDEVNRSPNSIVLTGEFLDEITRVGSMCDRDENVECDEDSKLDIDPPLTAYERLASVSADIEAWSNFARHNQESEVFELGPYREHPRTILGLLRHEILSTILELIFFKRLRPLRYLRRCRSFVLRHFHKVRNPHVLDFEIDRESMIHEAVWRVPVWNLEYSMRHTLHEATKSSEARYQTSLHLGICHKYIRNAGELSSEVCKHGLLQSVRFRILSIINVVKIRFHMVMAVMSSKSPAHRLARVCCILPSIFYAVIPVRVPSRWLDEAADFTSLYMIAMSNGPPSRVVQTKRGYIGVATSSSQPGDKICVFSGSRVAHVLRERGNGQDGYTLIGDAFVYGKTYVGNPVRPRKDHTSFEIF